MSRPAECEGSLAEPAVTPSREPGLLGLHLAVFLLGGVALFSQLIPISASGITGFRGVIATACLLPIVLWLRIPLSIRGARDLALTLLGGVMFAFHWWTNFAAVREAGVAIAIAVLYTFPIMTALIEPLFERRLPQLRTLAMAGGVAFGVWLAAGSAEVQAGRGVWLGLASAALLSFRNVLQRRYLSHYSGLTLMLYQSVVSAALFAADAWAAAPLLDPRSAGLLLVLGAVFTALPHALVATSLRTIPATRVAMILALQVLYASALGALVLGELPDLRVWAGGAIIVATTIAASLRPDKA